MKTVNLENFTYNIVEVFHSIQGEGFWAGVNAFFIRLGGCDVHCPWCDQKESWALKGYPQQSVRNLVEKAKQHQPQIVVITGGEPLMHNLNPLTLVLKEQRLQVHLETSGAYPFSGQFDWVTFSPKPYKAPHYSIYEKVNELKVIIQEPKDLNWAEAQAAKVSPNTVKYLQPEWNTPTSQAIVFEYVLANPQWRLSLQAHKFLGVR